MDSTLWASLRLSKIVPDDFVASLHAGYFPIWSVACAVRTDLCEADKLVVRMAHATRVMFDGGGTIETQELCPANREGSQRSCQSLDPGWRERSDPRDRG